jgi:hypothetical protein
MLVADQGLQHLAHQLWAGAGVSGERQLRLCDDTRLRARAASMRHQSRTAHAQKQRNS